MIHIINQPWDGRGAQMGYSITRLLASDAPRFEIFRACVAFAKASGVLRLAPALQRFMDRGGQVEIVVGIDEDITTRQALELAVRFSTAAYVFNNPAATFHPKVYLFEIPDRQAVAFVGSSNLTVGGLYTNYEANLGVDLDLTQPADRETYHRIRAIFTNACDVVSGNALRLDAATIGQLTQSGAVGDEARSRGRRARVRRIEPTAPPLFPRAPVLPPPPIDPSVADLTPRIEPTGDAEGDQEATTALQSWQTFVMILGERDTRQGRGYSHDIYIPLAARNQGADFWDWPAKFESGGMDTVGRYAERRIDILIRSVRGNELLVEGVRLYDYDIKREFRLNCGRLVEGARPGDLLVIQKSPAGTFFEGHTYEFEATVIADSAPAYQAFVRECRVPVPNSPKRWGYT